MEEIEFGLKLQKVKVEEINFKEPDDSFIEKFNENLLKIRMGFKFNTQLNIEQISVITNVVYDYDDENDDNQNVLLSYTAVFEFKIDNLKKVVIEHDRGLDIPNPLLAMLAGVSISTTRGIIIAKTAGTFVNSFYVPIVNPEEIINNLITKNSN